MENKLPRLVIELPPDVIERLYNDFLEGTLTKEDAARLYLEFTETASPLVSDKSELTEHPADSKLLAVRADIKNLLTKDLGKALAHLKQRLNQESAAFDDLITLFARYNRIINALQRGIIDFQMAEQEFVKIDTAVIFIVNNLQSNQLR